MNYKEDPAKTWIVLRTEPGKAPEYVATLECCYTLAEARSEYAVCHLPKEAPGVMITFINLSTQRPTSMRVKAAEKTLECI